MTEQESASFKGGMLAAEDPLVSGDNARRLRNEEAFWQGFHEARPRQARMLNKPLEDPTRPGGWCLPGPLPMTTAAVLQRAAEILDCREHWTTEVNARNAAGGMLNVSDDAACAYCLVGALMRAVHELSPLKLDLDDEVLRWMPAVRDAVEAVGSVLRPGSDPGDAGSICTEFNDCIALRWFDVRGKLRAAAAAAAAAAA